MVQSETGHPLSKKKVTKRDVKNFKRILMSPQTEQLAKEIDKILDDDTMKSLGLDPSKFYKF
jgi:hypothetical protein